MGKSLVSCFLLTHGVVALYKQSNKIMQLIRAARRSGTHATDNNLIQGWISIITSIINIPQASEAGGGSARTPSLCQGGSPLTFIFTFGLAIAFCVKDNFILGY